MSTSRDWFPTVRTGQLTMAKNWGQIMGSSAALWNIPPATVQQLTALTGEAESALAEAQNETTRTPVATARCKEAFMTLETRMRDLKKRFLYVPPLAESDLVSLGLKIPDTHHTPTGTPAAQVTIETYLVGRHELGIKIIYVTGDPNDPANKGFRIYYKAVAPGSAPPAAPGELIKSFYTKRKKDVMEFEFGDSGKTAFFALQIENEGRKGPWGPLVSALIP